MRALFTYVFLALVAGTAGAQDSDFPPGVLLLSRIKRHVREELDHLPAYTCLETVERSSNEGHRRKGLEPVDTIRLEILYTGRKELYASPGAKNFRDEHPSSYVAGGMIGDGIFASHLHGIFVSENALFTYRGEESIGQDRGWAHAAKYDYRIPLPQSGWTISVPGGSGVVASKGSFWVDPDTLDLLKVDVYADDIPPTLPVKDVVLTLAYGRMRIGAGDIMLPQTASLRMIESDGKESLDQFDFTHCRSYLAESSISFDAPGNPVPTRAATFAPNAPPRPAASSGILPAGLTVPVSLTTAVASDSAVGTLLEGRITSDVVLKDKVMIPAGSAIHGRIRRLEHNSEADGYYIVGLEFTDVDAGGSSLRFYADLETASGAAGLEWLISIGNAHNIPGGYRSFTENIRLPDLPGVGSFFIRGSRFSLPAGFRMVWKTRAIE